MSHRRDDSIKTQFRYEKNDESNKNCKPKSKVIWLGERNSIERRINQEYKQLIETMEYISKKQRE